jgi:CheY-like chemotaxis protein
LSVLETEHGCEALTIYEQSHCSIDLILTDVVMPHMGGRELADRLRAVVPDIAVLYMSGHAQEPAVCQNMLDGCDFFIEKPFSLEALISEGARY